MYGPGVDQLDNDPALPVIRQCCRQLFGRQDFNGDTITHLYDWLLTEKHKGKAAADGMQVEELAALLLREITPVGGVQLDDDDPALSEFMSASDLATRTGATRDSVNAFLRRYRDDYPDCVTEVEARRRNEPHYLYRAADVLPALRAHLARVS
jgi:hypothetical protein